MAASGGAGRAASGASAGGGLARWQVLAAGVCALVLTIGVARFSYTPLLPVMRREAGLGVAAGGWLATFNYAGYLSGALLAASLSDLHQKFRLYRLGLVVAVASTALMAVTTQPVLWGVLRYVSGLSSAAGMLVASGLVLNWLMRHGYRPELGVHFAGLGAGLVVSGVAVALMSGAMAWDRQWLALGVLGLAFGVPAWAWMPPPGPMPAGTAAAAGPPPGGRWMALLIAAYCCAGVGYVVSATFLVAILEKLPLLAGRGAWIWVAVGVAAVPACFLWDRVAARTGEIPALLLAYALHTLASSLPVLSGGLAANLFGAALFGLTFVGIVSLTLALIGRRFPANPAKAMARLTVSYGVAQIAAPALTGLLAAATGSYRGALVGAAVAMLAGMGLLVALRRAPA